MLITKKFHYLRGGGACQTVVMRANSLGELELDPMFVTGEALIESEGEEVRLAAASDLSPGDRLNCSILVIKTSYV